MSPPKLPKEIPFTWEDLQIETVRQEIQELEAQSIPKDPRDIEEVQARITSLNCRLQELEALKVHAAKSLPTDEEPISVLDAQERMKELKKELDQIDADSATHDQKDLAERKEKIDTEMAALYRRLASTLQAFTAPRRSKIFNDEIDAHNEHITSRFEQIHELMQPYIEEIEAGRESWRNKSIEERVNDPLTKRIQAMYEELAAKRASILDEEHAFLRAAFREKPLLYRYLVLKKKPGAMLRQGMIRTGLKVINPLVWMMTRFRGRGR